MAKKILYLVVPCYNEEEILNYSANILKEKLKSLIEKELISNKSKILFVDDGSTDKTWEIIVSLNKESKIITGIKLSRNQGHQNALLAGLKTANKIADITISIDADLQDDINAIDEMIEAADAGYDIVFGVRRNRKKDSFFKKTTAELFYKLMNFLGAKTIFNHADFRLMNKKAMNALEKFQETNLFLRGIISNLGFKTCCVYYNRDIRKAGKSKYPLNKMISFAINGITSCSTKLLHLIFITGAILLFLGLITGSCVVLKILKKVPLNLTIIISSIWAIGGLILISLGIIGEYIGKIYMETKKRPRYIISKNLIDEEENEN